MKNPPIFIRRVEDRLHSYVFDVSTYDRKKWRQLRQMCLRVDNEQDYIEWQSIIDTQIEKYMPEGPPLPIFSSEQEIQAFIHASQLKSELKNELRIQDSESTMFQDVVL